MLSARPLSRPTAVGVALALIGLIGVAIAITWSPSASGSRLDSGPVLAEATHYRFGTAPWVHHVVVLGDSVATGAGCVGCRPFGSLLARQLRQLSGQGVLLAAFAHDGLTSAGLQQQLYDDAGAVDALRQATAVTITIGANDFDSGQADSGCQGSGTSCYDGDLAALPGHVRAVLARVRALAGPQVRILLTGYWSVFLDGQVAAQRGGTYTATSDALTRRVNTVLAQAAAAGAATYVDLYASFHGDNDGDDTALLAADGDHPSQAGHQLIAHLLERSLRGR